MVDGEFEMKWEDDIASSFTGKALRKFGKRYGVLLMVKDLQGGGTNLQWSASCWAVGGNGPLEDFGSGKAKSLQDGKEQAEAKYRAWREEQGGFEDA